METERAMQATLLLGRFASTLRKQIELVSSFPESFEGGWQAALQEESLRRTLLSLNLFLDECCQEQIGPISFSGATLWEWEEVLRSRLAVTEEICAQTRKEALAGTALAENIFPELEAGA